MLLFRGASKRPHSVKSAVRRLAVSRFISMAGTDATGVAIGFALYAQTHSATWLSASLMLTVGAGALLSPFGGRAAELIDRRRLMIAAEIAAATVFAALAIVHTPVALLALGLLATAIGTVFGPASGAAIAHVAGEQNLTWASSVIATGANVGKTAGRLAAGALIAAIGVTSVFVLDALTFVASALIIATVHRSFSARQDVCAAAALHPAAAHDATVEPESSDAAVPDIAKGGMRLLAADRKLRLLTATACVSTFATAFTMTAEVPLVFQLGVGALGLGALTACWGGGMIIGSWYAGRALHRGNEATGVLVGRLAMATGVGLIAAAPSLGPMLACYLLGGLGGGFMGVAAQSMIMRSVDDDVRGRLLGAIESCRNTAFGLGVIGAGATVELLGPRPVYAAVGMTMALGTLPVAALVNRLGGMRPLRPLPAIAA
jgi:predicted MFS family arabinose efflux permease